MNDLLEKLEAAMSERERVASLALRWRKDYLERDRLETWQARRYVNNETPPYYDYWAVEAHLGALVPQFVVRFDNLPGLAELDARFFAANSAATVLRRVARDRKLIELITSEKHHVSEDCWYTCAAATEEREGETTCRDDASDECDCGRDFRVRRLLRLLAEDYEIEVES